MATDEPQLSIKISSCKCDDDCDYDLKYWDKVNVTVVNKCDENDNFYVGILHFILSFMH